MLSNCGYHMFLHIKLILIEFKFYFKFNLDIKTQLVLGIGSYGRSFKLKEGFESCPLINTPSDGPGNNGKFI